MTDINDAGLLLQRFLDNAEALDLHNTIHLPKRTCAVCRGALLHGRAQLCTQCEASHTEDSADLVGSAVYACSGQSSGQLMHRYKRPDAPTDDARLVAILVAIGLLHRRCADAIVGLPATHWTAVPSLSNIGSEHPFRTILAGQLEPSTEISVAASQLARRLPPKRRRVLDPQLFNVLTPVPPGSHITIIDDTWTSGAHARSVAMALKHAGAGRVSVLTVARWLDSDSGYPKWTYTNLIRKRFYDPNICPWTAADCPTVTVLPPPQAPIPWPGFSWDAPGRIAPACRMILDILSDGRWHTYGTIAARVGETHDLQTETVVKLLDGMVKTSGVHQRGSSKGRARSGSDTREVRLAQIE